MSHGATTQSHRKENLKKCTKLNNWNGLASTRTNVIPFQKDFKKS